MDRPGRTRPASQRTAGAALVALVLGWLLGALHHVVVPHVHDGCSGRLLHVAHDHRDGTCCSHAADGDEPAQRAHGPRFARGVDGHWHGCSVQDVAPPGPVPVRVQSLARRCVPCTPERPAPGFDVEEREPRHRLAPKGSPPSAVGTVRLV